MTMLFTGWALGHEEVRLTPVFTLLPPNSKESVHSSHHIEVAGLNPSLQMLEKQHVINSTHPKVIKHTTTKPNHEHSREAIISNELTSESRTDAAKDHTVAVDNHNPHRRRELHPKRGS